MILRDYQNMSPQSPPPHLIDESHWSTINNTIVHHRPSPPSNINESSHVRTITLSVVGFSGVLIFGCFIISLISNSERVLSLFGIEQNAQEHRLKLETTRKIEDDDTIVIGQTSLGFRFRLSLTEDNRCVSDGLDGVLSAGTPAFMKKSPSPISFISDVDSVASQTSSIYANDLSRVDSLKLPTNKWQIRNTKGHDQRYMMH